MPYYYLTVFLFLAFFTFLDAIEIEKRAKWLLAFAIMIIFVFTAGFRYETGVDWWVYQHVIFDNIPPIQRITTEWGRKIIFDTLDLGFNLSISLIKAFGGGIQLLFFLISSISSIFLFLSIRKYTEYPLASLLLYYCLIFFVLDMSGMRQALTLNIFLYSLRYAYEKRFSMYVFFIVIATLFHWSSIILLPLYYFINNKISAKAIYIVLFGAMSIFFFNITWLENTILFFVPAMENEILLAKTYAYTVNPTYARSWEFNLTTIINVSTILIMVFLMIRFRDKLEKRFNYFNIFFNVFLLQSITYFSFAELVDISDRLRMYFLVSNVILLPYLLSLVTSRIVKVLFSSVLIAYGMSYSRAYILEREATVAHHPYQNYLIYKTFNLESTGRERLEKHHQMHER